MFQGYFHCNCHQDKGFFLTFPSLLYQDPPEVEEVKEEERKKGGEEKEEEEGEVTDLCDLLRRERERERKRKKGPQVGVM